MTHVALRTTRDTRYQAHLKCAIPQGAYRAHATDRVLKAKKPRSFDEYRTRGIFVKACGRFVGIR